ncbi:hypothetical protein STANM309S_06011 [Streptomyces tanashiensis]
MLVLVAGGLSNDEIAERLDVSPLTVKTHVNRAMAKLGARDRAQLVVIGVRVRPGTPAGGVSAYSRRGMRGIRKWTPWDRGLPDRGWQIV